MGTNKAIRISLQESNKLIEGLAIEANELSFPKENMPILELHLIGRRLEASEIKRALSEVYEATGSALTADEEEALVRSILAASKGSNSTPA